MRLKYTGWLLATAVLLVSLQHVSHVGGSLAGVVLRGIFYGAQVTTFGLTMASWATHGCSYYPSICHLKDEIHRLEPQAREFAEDVKDLVVVIKDLDGENVANYNTLISANAKNERIVGKLEMIREYSNDIVVLLKQVRGIEVMTIDPEQLETDANAYVNQLASVDAQMKAFEKAMEQQSMFHGVALAVEVLPKLAYVGRATYRWYQWRKNTRGIDMSNLQRQKIQKMFMNTQTSGQRLNRVQQYVRARPKLQKALKVGAYGVHFLLNGLILGFDIMGAKKSKESLTQVRNDLRDIINNAQESKRNMSEIISTERGAKDDLFADFLQVREGLTNATDFVKQAVNLPSKYQSVSLAAINNVLNAAATVPISGLNHNLTYLQDKYIDWLIEEEDKLQSVFNRLKAINATKNMLSYTGFQAPVTLVLQTARAHDATITKDIVLTVIALEKPDQDTWPDFNPATGQMTMVNLAPYRVTTTTTTTTTVAPRRPAFRFRMPRIRMPMVNIRRRLWGRR